MFGLMSSQLVWLGRLIAIASVNGIAIAIAQPSLAQAPAKTENESVKTPAATAIEVKPGEELRVKIDRLPKDNIAIFLGDLDITSQMVREGDELVYRSTVQPLPVGEKILTIYRTTSQRWDEIATFKVKVEGSVARSNDPNESGTPKPEPGTSPPPGDSAPSGKPAPPNGSTPPPAPTNFFTPKLNFSAKSQILETRTADAIVTAPRPTALDLSFTGKFTGASPLGSGNVQGKLNLTGSSFKPEALRFSTLQDRAPNVDVSDYVIDFTEGDHKLTVGHGCYGTHPLLVNNLCTRGISGKVKLNNLVDVSIGHVSTTAIVGFDTLLGFEQSENNLSGATLGLQIANNAAGGVRLETTWMNGSRLPAANFNVGEVVDAEKSDGIGWRLTAVDDGGRWKGDAGFARSTFNTSAPNDPQLNGGDAIVPLQSVTRNAWYAETSYDLLKDLKIDPVRNLSLAANLRLERIDPQYGTVGATIIADRLQAQYGLNANISGATLQFQHTDADDNLADLPNLLKTRNQSDTVSLSLPLQSFLKTENTLLPTVSYIYQQTNQRGSILAAASGAFDEPSKIPNQLNISQEIGAGWKFSDALSFDYKFINALQDNRQVGRETADFRNLTHQFTLGWQPDSRLRFNLGYNLISAQNIERNLTRFTQTPTFGVSWEFIRDLTFAFNYNLNDDFDSIQEASTRTNSLDLLLTWNFQRSNSDREAPGNVFLRYAIQSNQNRNTIGNINTDATVNTLSTGMTWSF
jgi:hypothetical protein